MAGRITATTGATTPAGLSTPITMDTIDDPGVYELRVDWVNMTGSDTDFIRLTRGNGVVEPLLYQNGDPSPNGSSAIFTVYEEETGVLLRLEQTAGSVRAVPWVLVRMYDDTVT
jgi:hypothetical protein